MGPLGVSIIRGRKYKENDLLLGEFIGGSSVFCYDRLVYNYEGPIMKVRRESDNSLLDI